jgi:EAL domain-containing protein (putative c-di-GMP-specific phosphodiesterase class I)
VLSFTQDDVRRFTAIEQATIQSFSALGIRFAVAEVTDLDMNFAAMSRAGFSFATIPAAILLAGLPGVDGVVPAGAVAGHLAVAGFSAIVIDIEDEGQLADIRKAAIALGQGPHFGGPQRVKADVVGGATRKAA